MSVCVRVCACVNKRHTYQCDVTPNSENNCYSADMEILVCYIHQIIVCMHMNMKGNVLPSIPKACWSDKPSVQNSL